MFIILTNLSSFAPVVIKLITRSQISFLDYADLLNVNRNNKLKNQNSLHRKDMWTGGASYESYIGRWSRLVARQFVPWLNVPSGAQWLDVGCETGTLIHTILDTASPRAVLGIDSSEGYIDFARKEVQDPHVAFRLGDAQALPVKSAAYDGVVSGLVLNFIPKPSQALREMIRAVRIGGIVAAYVWDYADKMQLIRYFWNAAVALD